MRFLIIVGCLIAVIAISGCGSSSSQDSPRSASDDTSSSESTAKSPEPDKSDEKTNGSSESENTPTSATPLSKPPTKVEIPSSLPEGKLATKDIQKGAGTIARAGDEVTVQYVGVGVKSKETFDSTWKRGEPFSFELGAGQVIKGWDQGIEGMKVGGRRELYVPPELAYGSKGTSSISPNEPIVFVVDLLSVKPGA